MTMGGDLSPQLPGVSWQVMRPPNASAISAIIAITIPLVIATWLFIRSSKQEEVFTRKRHRMLAWPYRLHSTPRTVTYKGAYTTLAGQ